MLETVSEQGDLTSAIFLSLENVVSKLPPEMRTHTKIS